MDMFEKRRFAIVQACAAGFREADDIMVSQLMGAAKRLMEQAGFHVSPLAEQLRPVVMLACSQEALDFLEARGADAIYGWGVCLIGDVSRDDVIVHELVHHYQGIWTDSRPSDKSMPYQKRWEESQAFLIQRAYREGRNPRSLIVKLKHLWDGFTIPCCD